MNSSRTKTMTIEVSVECWKKLKIMSIQKDISIGEVVKDILEKVVNKKQVEEVKIE